MMKGLTLALSGHGTDVACCFGHFGDNDLLKLDVVVVEVGG